ncbi:MAG: VCBS repeat-containing protein, partial [Bacteroidetes bacterium]|nr:VCBS repeat-containing protein [Bacteroidota bacterium]
SIAFADTDGDGDQDLLLTGRNSSTYYAHFYLNDGSGNFTPDTTQPFEPSGGGNLDFADIDNDGDMDLFMTGFLAGNTRFSKLYQNDGTGNFSEITSTPFLDIGGTSSSAFFDMDNDNDLDLILTGKNNNNEKKTTLYENDGAGNFSLVSSTPFENVFNGGVAVADTDNDGDIDVLINGENIIGGFCQLYLNDGTGAFNPLAGTPFIQTSAGTADFADFDNDNDMDIIVTGAADQAGAFAAHIYENQGNNNFSLVDVLVTVYIPSTALGDIDND